MIKKEKLEMKFCPECGNKLEEGMKFCSECGYKLVDSSVQNPALREEKGKFSSSEELIKYYLKNTKESVDLSISPDITEKKLVNAATVIGNGVDTMKVVGLVDTTIFHSGKEGILFLGDRVYFRPPFGDSVCIEYNEIKDVKYEECEHRDSNNKITIEKLLEVHKKAGDLLRFSSTTYGFGYPLKLLADILQGILSDVEVIETTDQFLLLKDMGPECVSLYLQIITNYLYEDDGQLDKVEYKELIGLMGRLNVSKELADNLRKYRNGNILIPTEELVREIQNYIPKGSIPTIFQSLLNDILSISKNAPEDWKKDEIFVRYQRLLSVADSQVEFFVRRLLQDRRIIEEKIDDSTIKKAMSELVAVGTGAGVSLAALAVTGGVSTGIWGGLFTISMASTGGMALGLAAVGGLGYGAYRGIKYFSGTTEAEKYAIRSTMLQQKIKDLQKSENYLIEDINWTTTQIAELIEKKEEILDNHEKLLKYIQMAKTFDEGSRMIFEEERLSHINILLSHIPEKLDIDKFDELIKKTQYQVQFKEYVYQCYIKNENEEYILQDIDDEECLEKLDQILEIIGYYDVSKSAAAKTNVLVKKGISGLKGLKDGINGKGN